MFRKNNHILLLAILLAFSLSGCAQLKDKFVPKPKEEDIETQTYYVVREYDVTPSIELYTKRYTFWKNWHGEFLSVLLASNHKKKVVAVEQTLSNLMDMQSMLVENEAIKLQRSIDQMIEIEAVIKRERVTAGNEVRLRRKLETLQRGIRTRFNYNKMEGHIRDEFRGK